jgi:hypothetical protein
VNNADRGSWAILFENGSAESSHEYQVKKEIALEKWQATMELLAGGQTKDNIRKRALVGEAITGTRSRTEFERKSLDEILRAVNVLLALENRLKIDSPTNDVELKACCAMAAEDIDHPGKNMTLLETMLHKSVDQVNGQDTSAEPF